MPPPVRTGPGYGVLPWQVVGHPEEHQGFGEIGPPRNPETEEKPPVDPEEHDVLPGLPAPDSGRPILGQTARVVGVQSLLQLLELSGASGPVHEGGVGVQIGLDLLPAVRRAQFQELPTAPETVPSPCVHRLLADSPLQPRRPVHGLVTEGAPEPFPAGQRQGFCHVGVDYIGGSDHRRSGLGSLEGFHPGPQAQVWRLKVEG